MLELKREMEQEKVWAVPEPPLLLFNTAILALSSGWKN